MRKRRNNIKTLILITCLTLTLAMQAAPALAVTISDDIFNNADWTAQKFGDGNFTASQIASGGNPNEFRQTNHSDLNTGQSIAVFQILSTGVYDPSVSGAIASIDFSFDLKFIGGSTGTSQVGYRLALEQAGSFYFSDALSIALGPGDGAPGATWDSFAFSGLTELNFALLSGPGSLNFSASGDPIMFGYLTNNTAMANLVQTSSGIDNFSVTITPVPEPASVALLLAGIGTLLVWDKLRRDSA